MSIAWARMTLRQWGSMTLAGWGGLRVSAPSVQVFEVEASAVYSPTLEAFLVET